MLAPSEGFALAALLAGALAALGLLWLGSRPGLAEPVAPETAGVLAADRGVGADRGAGVDPGEVVVHVAGAVAKPGLYRLRGGTRIADALEAAGGPQPGAALDALNLARLLTDGEQLLVPSAAGAVPVPGASPALPSGWALAPTAGSAPILAPTAKRPDGTLDLNRATAEELDELPGIGPILAERIVAHREEAGGFKAVGALRDVPGIGEKTFQKLARLIAI